MQTIHDRIDREAGFMDEKVQVPKRNAHVLARISSGVYSQPSSRAYWYEVVYFDGTNWHPCAKHSETFKNKDHK